ncbi:CUN086 hypothetical protein ATP_GTP_A motif [Culex nigripalpus nucleopolyhedrovirus]|uniref:Uncharacterized protein n=1 Tax=Culex nigripalpus nucleopolyhedrovirus (isolate Florida/1997) TaxID=645993 RepID=Q919J0_NPVCO|nr:CUN086 hypothetical protein ATP_GTP_A motif [Culex nigripalpus nucleopolyhedrovirus]AAK94164.1 CUN086 hypothetical protein ATP_GTP_A motif [Culex nigripalpus nucleopolyhedrovirus]
MDLMQQLIDCTGLDNAMYLVMMVLGENPTNVEVGDTTGRIRFIEGTSGSGKSSAMVGRENCYTVDYVSITDQMEKIYGNKYREIMSHRCPGEGKCAEIGGRCPGESGKQVLYLIVATHMLAKICNNNPNRIVVDRNPRFSSEIYTIVRNIIAEGSLTEPSAYSFRGTYLSAEKWSQLMPRIESLAENFKGQDIVVILNEHPLAVDMMIKRGYFDVQNRTRDEVHQYLNVQNELYERVANRAGFKLIRSTGNNYGDIEDAIVM